jgi:MarR family 2-MHQ and catechol resistance regulon transcriptional repressor
VLLPTVFQGDDITVRALNAYIKLSRAAAAVEAQINSHLSDYGLTLSQFGVLEALYHLGPLHQHQLAKKILKSSGNLTLVVDNLVKRGLVERCREVSDRRYVQIHLTKSGQALIERIMPVHATRVRNAFGVLSAEEQETLGQLCKKLGLGQEAIKY